MQDNQSLSGKGVLRGLHFQCPPYAQGKLVRVIKGAVLDVAVDIRKDSSYLWSIFFSRVVRRQTRLYVWIPPGFGSWFFATLQDNTIFTYKCTGLYSKHSEGNLALE